MKIDDINISILNHLKDGRASFKKIADLLSLSGFIYIFVIELHRLDFLSKVGGCAFEVDGFSNGDRRTKLNDCDAKVSVEVSDLPNRFVFCHDY